MASHGDRDTSRIVAAVEVFKTLAEIPSVASADILRGSDGDNVFDVRLQLSARSYATFNRTTQRCNLALRGGKVVSTSHSQAVITTDDTVKALFSSLSTATSQWTVILRETSDKSGKEKRRLVELWRGERQFKTADVSEHHGAFIANETFGSFSIHDDMVLYSAEAKAPPKKADIASRTEKDGLQDWQYRPTLGEKFIGQKFPRVFLLHFHTKSKESPRLCRLGVAGEEDDQELSDALFGQAIFSSTGKEVFLTAYPTLSDGRRLGIIYCSNRPAAVYEVSLSPDAGGKVTDKDAVADRIWTPKRWTRLSTVHSSARSPRALWQGGCCWLESEEGGPHRSCDSLMSFVDGKVKVEIPLSETGSGWPGIYVDQLRRSCMLTKAQAVVTDSIWGSSKKIVLHRIGSNSAPLDLTPQGLAIKQGINQEEDSRRHPWSYTLLGTDGVANLLAVRSSPTHPPQVLLGSVEPTGDDCEWKVIYNLAAQWEAEQPLRSLRHLQSSVEDFPATKGDAPGDLPMQAVVLEQAVKKRPMPFILFPHGGPHGTSTTDWSPSNAALCLQGYTIAMPNYHGSLGRGNQFAHSLVGQCGRLDVDDCMACLHQLIEQGRIDKEQSYVQGGSHGGFLTAHLIGQFPDVFKSAIVRNPVVAAGIMEGTTDIPDWCYAEFGLPFHFRGSTLPPACPTAAQYEQLQAHSPVHNLDAIKTPLLILLGLEDQRVPPAQSKLLYHSLLARHKAVRMLAFEGEDHALDGVECELVAWEANLRWLRSASLS